MSEAQLEYQYTPLTSPTHIRLLNFLPCSTPKCELLIVPLSQAPAFIALSYTWGNPTINHNINVNTTNLPITFNLNSALAHLHVRLQRAGLLLWADGICINQQDLAERASQVTIMGQIYGAAQNVYIWLGPAAANSDLAFETMLAWKDLLVDSDPAHSEDWTNLAALVTKNMEFHGPPGSKKHEAWVAISELWERPWWQRIWIVQEVLKAKDTLIICGEKSMDWDCLMTTLFIQRVLEKSALTQIVSKDGVAYVTRLCDLYQKLEPYKRTGIGPATLTLLGGLKRLRCQSSTDPRDKVFAVLGLAAGVFGDTLKPDYTLSLDQVNLNVVRHLLEYESDQNQLDFLGHVLRSEPEADFFGEKKLPLTFVPNWAILKNMCEFPKDIIDGEAAGDSVYHACGTWKTRARLNGTLLTVDAMFVDIISEVSTACEDTEDEDLILRARSWIIPGDETFQYITGGTLRQAFLHAIVADVRQNVNGAVKRGFALDERMLVLSKDNTMEMGEFFAMINSLRAAIYGRRSFSSIEGYLGVGPAGSRIGDIICAFAGGHVLYVLRPRGPDEICEFIGECYVHGLMDGEAVVLGDKALKKPLELSLF